MGNTKSKRAFKNRLTEHRSENKKKSSFSRLHRPFGRFDVKTTRKTKNYRITVVVDNRALFTFITR